MMRKGKLRSLKNGHFILLLVWPLLLVLFFLCEKTVLPRYYMHSKIDDYIPFIKVFIIPYVLWYFYLGFGFIYLGFVSKQDFKKLSLYIFSGLMISYAIYLIFPNAQTLRPVVEGSDIFSQAIRLLYSLDTPTNVFPSLHVFEAIAVHISLARCAPVRKKRGLLWLSLSCMVAICMSTVFIKQHSILDVFGGSLLAVVIYVPVYSMHRVKWLLYTMLKLDS